MISTCRPASPPAALISSVPISSPYCIDSPLCVSRPVKGMIAPTRIGSPWAAAPRASREPARGIVPAAATPRSRVRRSNAGRKMRFEVTIATRLLLLSSGRVRERLHNVLGELVELLQVRGQGVKHHVLDTHVDPGLDLPLDVLDRPHDVDRCQVVPGTLGTDHCAEAALLLGDHGITVPPFLDPDEVLLRDGERLGYPSLPPRLQNQLQIRGDQLRRSGGACDPDI